MTSGVKNDTGKLRYDLIPVEPLRELARVYTIGATKYDDRNWELGLQWGRVYAAMQRHANAWWGGEQRDPVDGQHHLASVAWCALALMEYERTHPELDDREAVPAPSVPDTLYCLYFWSDRSADYPGVYDTPEKALASLPSYLRQYYTVKPID